MLISREDLAVKLKEFFYSKKDVIAVWESGSAATGYLDEYSDMDIAVICEDNAVEQLFRELDGFLEENFGIERRFRIPEPAWHCFSQCFYKIGDTPELFYLDIALIKRSIPDKFTDIDRHGKAVLWFEKEKMLDPEPTDKNEIRKRAQRLYWMATEADFITVAELKKAIMRGIYTESFMNYYQLIRNLAVLLNLKYRTAKADFGLRYAFRDYPAEEYEFIENALKVSSLNDIQNKLDSVMDKFTLLKKQMGEELSQEKKP